LRATPLPLFTKLPRGGLLGNSDVYSFRSAFRLFCNVVFLRIVAVRFPRQRRRPVPRPRDPERPLVRGFVVRNLRYEAPVSPLCGTRAQVLGQQVFGELVTSASERRRG
jgi:hypothetical protein